MKYESLLPTRLPMTVFPHPSSLLLAVSRINFSLGTARQSVHFWTLLGTSRGVLQAAFQRIIQTKIFNLAVELGAFLLTGAHGQASWVEVDSFILACLPFCTGRFCWWWCFCCTVFSELTQTMLRTLPGGCRTRLLHLWLLQTAPSATGNAQHSLGF